MRVDAPDRDNTYDEPSIMPTTPERVHIVFEEAFNRHDLEAVIELYEPDAVFVAAHGQATGREAIRDAYRTIFASSPSMELRTLAITRVGELAMLQGQWTVRRMGENSNEGRSVEIVRLQADGRWRFVIDNPSVA